MKKLVCGVCVLAGLASFSFGQQQGGQGESFFVSDRLGVSMEVPVSEETGEGNFLMATFLLPVKDGFSGNVSVIRQKFEGDLASYDKLSMAQFKSAGMVVTSRRAGKSEIVYEYKGDVRGKPMRYYARAVRNGGGEWYLLTATCLESAWREQGAKLVKSVDSFKVKQ